jgi:hypothetical protein
MTRQTPVFAIVIITTLAGIAAAQSGAKPAALESGMTSYVEFRGTSDSDGQIYEVNSNVGYDFNSHFGVAVGAPVYFVRPSSASGGTSSSGLGNPYLTLHLKYPGPMVNFASALTGAAPVGDSKKGLSTGRATFDWTNRFDHAISNLAPFVEVGIANTTPDSGLFLRPYTTLGLNTHFQGGASYDVWKFISAGASGYDILPIGQQTVFSRVTQAQGNGGPVQHGRIFENNQQTTGGAGIDQDDGFSAWIDAKPGRSVVLELGFTRSLVYDLNSISFDIGINLGQLYRSNQK